MGKCEEKVDEVFPEKRVLENNHIARAYRVKRGKNDKSTKPRTIVCNLLSLMEKASYEKCKEIEKYEHFHR